MLSFKDRCHQKWEKVVEPDGPQMKTWHVHIACWVPRAMNTSEPTEFPLILSLCLIFWPVWPWGKGPQYPWNQRVGGPQRRLGRFGESLGYRTTISPSLYWRSSAAVAYLSPSLHLILARKRKGIWTSFVLSHEMGVWRKTRNGHTEAEAKEEAATKYILLGMLEHKAKIFIK